MKAETEDPSVTTASTPVAAATMDPPIRTFLDLPLFPAFGRPTAPPTPMLPPPAKRPAPDALDALLQRIARRTGHDGAVVEHVVRAFLEATTHALAESGAVDLRPLGSFHTAHRRERTGRHPRTGEPLRIPARRGVAFRIGKRLRERVDVPKDIARLLDASAEATVRAEAALAPPAPVLVPPPLPAKRARLVGIASGKGGTGKTFLAANLAVALALSGLGVAAVDADLGLANLHLLLGVQPLATLGPVVFENAPLAGAIHRGPAGVDLVSGGSGATALADLKREQLDRLVAEVLSLGAGRDVVLVDTAAGLSPRTLRLLGESDLCLLATTPEVTAMTDAYALLKTLVRTPGRRPRIALVVNQARTEAEGKRAHEKLRSVSEKFLDAPLDLWGVIPEDPEVVRSVARRTPITLDPAARGPAADALRSIAAKVRDWARSVCGPMPTGVGDPVLT